MEATEGSRRSRYPTIKESYEKAINSGSKESALLIMREEQPRHFVLQYTRLCARLDKAFVPQREPYISPFPLSSFTNVPEDMQKWANEYILCDTAARPLKPKSIIIEGPSRIGKTIWARVLGKHNYLCGYLDLNPNVYSNDAEYNVIDNIEPKSLKIWKELIGAERDWQFKCKYGPRVQIKGGIPAIVLCNPGPGWSYAEYLDRPRNKDLKAWTLEHAIFVTLQEEPLFST